MLYVFITPTSLYSQTEFKYTGNPLVRHIFTADPTARVFDGKLYVYTSHDLKDADYYTMKDWRVFSTDNMEDWIDYGDFFGLDDIPWAKSMAWAPDCVKRGDKYYFYYPVERTKIGVAVSSNPVSGFKDSGKPLIDNTSNVKLIGPEPIDPSVIIDNGQAYIFFGCREFRWAKLNDDMVSIKGKINKVKLIGNEGDKEGFGGYYGEGPFIFKKDGLFYIIYSNGWGNQSTIVYATSKSVEGPFEYKGEVIKNVGCSTSHGSIVEFKNKYYLFYHTRDLSGHNNRRSVCFDLISFDKNGNIVPAVKTTSSLVSGKDYYTGKGRIALSSDGNMHDNDDMQATMMSLMILAKAGLQDKTSLYVYADHVWGSEKNDLEIMRHSAEECGKRFSFDNTRFIAAVENPEQAYEAMCNEILKSTAENPLFIVAAGPMQVVGEALNRAFRKEPASLSYVTVISHSEWNNEHADKPHANEKPHSGWTWNKMEKSFGQRVNFNLISDQNGTGISENAYKSKNKFKAPSWISWEWMKESSDSDVRWVYEQTRKKPAGPDFSDAGLVYYLCADLDGERGDENGNPIKLKYWLEQVDKY
ncbi:hypothetical protein DXA05_08840 [Bacteroides sp. AM54-2NS]|nr:hypothetical protein DXA05_08840 [Bacteroides sp. AM54-2NS]